jgi:proteasome lid subunit RPN8/RPN11
MLLLSETLTKEIRSHGAKDYPNETCGAMLGVEALNHAGNPENVNGSEPRREVKALFPLTNRRDDSPRNRFSVTADDVRAAERAAAASGLELIGWYHSHPDHPARPSEYDREYAWPWYSYVIVSVAAGEPRDLTSWLLADDRSQFHAEEIQSGVAAPPAK